jgi:hypothetical protein
LIDFYQELPPFTDFVTSLVNELNKLQLKDKKPLWRIHDLTKVDGISSEIKFINENVFDLSSEGLKFYGDLKFN